MKFVNANAEYLDPSTMHPYEFMELAGRTCYKSEANITKDSSTKFVAALMKNGHTAMLEHSHLYFKVQYSFSQLLAAVLHTIEAAPEKPNNYTPYINITDMEDISYVSASFRTFINICNMPSGIELLSATGIYPKLHEAYPELFEAVVAEKEDRPNAELMTQAEFIQDVGDTFTPVDVDNILRKHVTHTIKFTCDRGVSHEFVRHRPASFAQESTRYCNYSKDRFGNEITVIRPYFFKDSPEKMRVWEESCVAAQTAYRDLLESGATPQEARSVLPTSLKTELIITATEEEWQHIINLRYHGTTGKPHPQMFEVMEIAYPILVNNSDFRLQ